MRRKITFLLTFLVAVLIIALAGGRVYADTGYEVEDYANQDFCYVNPDTGYEAVIVDDAFLLSVAEKSMLLEKMKLITTYGNVMFNSISYNSTSTESYIKSLYREKYGSESGTIFVIDMDNRNIWMHSNGAINRTINKAYAETITDNVYTYASDADYYICAMKVYEQEYTLLQGRKIAQPMKYISNALLAVVIAVVINYIIVRVYSSKRKASTKSLMNGLFEYRAFNNCNVVFTHQTKTYSPRESSSGGSSGGGGGGGSSGGGGGSGGGGHSF